MVDTLLSPISKLNIPFSNSKTKSEHKDITSTEYMARALMAAESEKRKAKLKESTPIRNAIVEKINMIIRMVLEPGAKLNAFQWATAVLALKQIGPSLAPHAQRAVSYLVAIASSKIAQTAMQAMRAGKSKLLGLLAALCKRVLEHITARSAIRSIHQSTGTFLEQVNRITTPSLAMLRVASEDSLRELPLVQVVVRSLNELVTRGELSLLPVEATPNHIELVQRLGFKRPQMVTYTALHAVLQVMAYPSKFKSIRQCCAHFNVSPSSFYDMRQKLDEALSTSAGEIIHFTDQNVSTELAIELDTDGQPKVKVNIKVDETSKYSVGEAPSLYVLTQDQIVTPQRPPLPNTPQIPPRIRTWQMALRDMWVVRLHASAHGD